VDLTAGNAKCSQQHKNLSGCFEIWKCSDNTDEVAFPDSFIGSKLPFSILELWIGSLADAF
jgi:hypothetical protein